MGMGEPMDNLDAVLAAVDACSPTRPRRGSRPRNVTVSTSGVVPGMERFLRECRAHLALSLNATTDAQRERLMPHNRHLAHRRAARTRCARTTAAGSGRRYFIEYVLWDGRQRHATTTRAGWSALLAGLPAHVNLIPHNAFAGNPLRPPPRSACCAFQRARAATAACAASCAGRAAATSRRPAGSSRCAPSHPNASAP